MDAVQFFRFLPATTTYRYALTSNPFPASAPSFRLCFGANPDRFDNFQVIEDLQEGVDCFHGIAGTGRYIVRKPCARSTAFKTVSCRPIRNPHE
jgi:hypothetical protein